VNWLGGIFGLLSAVIWGSADFSGGVAARRAAPFQVVTLGSLSGLIVMGAIAWLMGESRPQGTDMAWAGIAGLLGTPAWWRPRRQ
jgi:hypothetical protein